jgi:hypothetical protein
LLAKYGAKERGGERKKRKRRRKKRREREERGEEKRWLEGKSKRTEPPRMVLVSRSGH